MSEIRVHDAFEELRDQANAWLARFAPLVMSPSAGLTESEVRKRLESVERLKSEAGSLRPRLGSLRLEDADLANTVEQALRQLDSVEEELRRTLGKLVPGDPAGLVDLDALQDRLAEREARQELGLHAGTQPPEILEMKTSSGNWAGALSMGIFGLGWTAFTTFHATLMIIGMSKAFGWGALALLLFYSIFYLVGFGMLAGAFSMASTESIRLEGRHLTITRSLGPFRRTRVYELAETAKATIGTASNFPLQAKGQRPTRSVLLHDVNAKAISLSSHSDASLKQEVMDRINAYLQVHG
ncbi:MAG TPA: hypothetical protein PLH94_11110 [Fimbriimonadaceae bacterium]|nr:hypothetical protein [Fimbriimonadaceae bacterium]